MEVKIHFFSIIRILDFFNCKYTRFNLNANEHLIFNVVLDIIIDIS